MVFSIEIFIIGVFITGLLAYVISSLNAYLGSIMTILVSMFTFVVVLYSTYIDASILVVPSTIYLPLASYGFNALNSFFLVIVTFIFSMTSFFNPVFIHKYTHKNTYSMLWMFVLAGVLGIFYSTNFLSFFFFFEIVVWTSMFYIPMGRNKETTKVYFGFSLFGSLILLLGIFSFYYFGVTVFTYLLFIVAAFVKLGLWPFNIWLPKVLTDTPDVVTALFSGAIEKLGAYIAVLALVFLAPVSNTFEAVLMPYSHYIIALIGSLSIIFGTFMAIRQDDAKTLLAYSSMANGGYILVAFSMTNSIAVSGGLYHVVAHALASTAAYLAIAAVSRQTNTTKISELGGMIHKMPFTYMVYLIAIISIAGIPPMGGFISKWLIFQSVLNKGLIFITLAVTIGSIGSFLYVFRPLAALFLGQELREYSYVKEVNVLMMIPMAILSLLIVATGVFTTFFLSYVNDVVVVLGFDPIVIANNTIKGWNASSMLHPMLMAIIFGVGIVVAFIIFILLKKSKKVGLMDTYTAANFVHNEQLLHYTKDFYAPFERLYEKYVTITEDLYDKLRIKVTETGRFLRYLFFGHLVENFVFYIILIIVFMLVGEVL